MNGSTKKKLSFQKNGEFKIMAIGDIHEKINPDEKTEDFLRLMNAAAEEKKPDVAVILGDIISGTNRLENRHATPEELFEGLKRITEPLVSRGIPFAVTFGNHDGETGEPKEVLFDLLKKIPGFLNTNDSGATGCGNCFSLIYDSEGEKPVFNLWFIDSGNRAQDGSGGYAWVDDSQIAWYEKNSNALKKQNDGNPIPSLVFQHIPVCEEYLLLKETTIFNPYKAKGHGRFSDKYFVKRDNCHGYLGEGPCSPDKNNGQFKSWVKQGDVIGAFFGHDHLSDFVGLVHGIVLGQTKCSGFHIYGDGLMQGVRMLTLRESDPWSFETEMVRYRDFFGTKCNSIKGYMLYPDRWHTNFETSLKIAGAGAAAAAVAVCARQIIKQMKKRVG